MDGKRGKVLFHLLYRFGRKYKWFYCFPVHLALWFFPLTMYLVAGVSLQKAVIKTSELGIAA